MSLKFGLNVKKKAPLVAVKKSIWDEPPDDGEEIEQLPPQRPATNSGPPRKFGLNIPAAQDDRPPNALAKARAAEQKDSELLTRTSADDHASNELDQALFDYDSFHDAKSTIDEARKAAARQEAVDRKPKYIENLMNAAARRKLDQQAAKEVMTQREREAEGDEFADKETFVTGAYKQQQAETKRLQEEEEKRLLAEEELRRKQGGGMKGLYRTMMDQTEAKHQEAMALTAQLSGGAAVKLPTVEQAGSRDDAANELKAKGIKVNDEGQVVDKRDLLTSGLNIAPSGHRNGAGSDHLKVSAQAHRAAVAKRDHAAEQAQRERQARMIEEQMAASAKRKREEEDEQRAKDEREAKSKKTEGDISDAKARYLARKAAKEKGEG